jgi:hypothetical protein
MQFRRKGRNEIELTLNVHQNITKTSPKNHQKINNNKNHVTSLALIEEQPPFHHFFLQVALALMCYTLAQLFQKAEIAWRVQRKRTGIRTTVHTSGIKQNRTGIVTRSANLAKHHQSNPIVKGQQATANNSRR